MIGKPLFRGRFKRKFGIILIEAREMSRVIEVIYKNGVFKPFGKVRLKEGERFKIMLKRIDLKKFVMSKLAEKEINKLEKRFENENIY